MRKSPYFVNIFNFGRPKLIKKSWPAGRLKLATLILCCPFEDFNPMDLYIEA